MVAKLDDGEYMAFGLSGDPRRTKMIGGKFFVFQKMQAKYSQVPNK